MQADPNPNPARERASRRWVGVLLLFVLASELGLVAAHRWLPSNDGPSHQYSAWVAHELRHQPTSPLARWFALNPSPVYPNTAYTWFLEDLVGRVPMPVAERLGAAVYLIGLPFALAVLCAALGREPLLPALAAAVLSLNFLFFMGFFNFLWGVPCALLFLACFRKSLETAEAGAIVACNALLALTFCAHLVAFGAAVAGAVALTLTTRAERWWTGPAAVAPVAVAALFFWPASVAAETGWRWREPLGERLSDVFLLGIGSSFGGAERAAALVLAVALLAAALAGLRSVTPGRSALVLLAGTYGVLAVALPSDVGAGGFLTERMSLFFWLVVLAALPVPGARVRVAAGVALALLAAAHVAFLAPRFRAFEATLASYLEGVDHIPPGADLYGWQRLHGRADFIVQPMATVQSYYHLALGSPHFEHYQAAPRDAPHFPLRYTREGRRRFVRSHPRDRLPLARVARWAEYLVIWTDLPADLQRIRAGGYRQIWAQGATHVFRRQPRPRDATAAGEAARAGG